jgi:hypothetical protein
LLFPFINIIYFQDSSVNNWRHNQWIARSVLDPGIEPQLPDGGGARTELTHYLHAILEIHGRGLGFFSGIGIILFFCLF